MSVGTVGVEWASASFTLPAGPVAQRQSRGLLILVSWVRIPPGPPRAFVWERRLKDVDESVGNIGRRFLRSVGLDNIRRLLGLLAAIFVVGCSQAPTVNPTETPVARAPARAMRATSQGSAGVFEASPLGCADAPEQPVRHRPLVRGTALQP